MKKNKHAIFYSLIMAIVMLALGIVSFWGRGQGNFKGIYSKAPLAGIEQKWTDKSGKAVDIRELKPGKDGTLTIYYRLPKKVNGQDKIIFSPDISSRLMPISETRKSIPATRRSRLTG